MFQIYYKFQLVSRCFTYVMFIYNGILKFDYNWYLKNFVYKISQNLFLIRKIKTFFICIAYMQGELNISSTYRFMMSVSSIDELDNSSLCDTRV